MESLLNHLLSLGLTLGQSQKIMDGFKMELNLNRNEYFHKEGQTCNLIGFVVSGTLRHFYNSENGEEITRWMGLSGEFITSLSSFISRSPATENIKAITPCKILILTRDYWAVLMKTESSLNQLWQHTIEQHYIGLETRVYNLIALDANQRYQWVVKYQPRFIKEVPDKYLASMIGIEPRHLSRLRRKKK